MLEKDIEKYVKQNVDGYLLKWVSPGESGVPDRIHLKPSGRITFIEFKKPGGRLSERQKLWIMRMEAYGIDVQVISSMEEATAYVEETRVSEYLTLKLMYDEDRSHGL